MPFGTYVKLIEYELSRYARGAHEPKQSLWHLFHAALPDPPLPLQIIETRDERFRSVRGVERRSVSGLLYLLERKGTADYSDEREIDLGPLGKVTLRYYVLNEDRDPDAYTTSKQGMTITLNGQRQITRDRAWVKRQVDLPFLYKRMVIAVDGTGLSNKAKRAVFSSTRETGVDTPEAQSIIERVIDELDQDENLSELDAKAKQRVLDDAQKTTTTKVKKQLAEQIGALLSGELAGGKGGSKRRKRRKRRRHRPGPGPTVDDSAMLDIPDTLKILNEPVRIEPGATGSLRLEINAKNGFLPKHAGALSVVFGPEVAEHVSVASTGRLLGGKVRVTLQAGDETPITTSTVQVALVVADLGVLLTAHGTIDVVKAQDKDEQDSKTGGEPNIEVSWVRKDKWTEFEDEWDAQTVGECHIHREDPSDPTAITKVEWFMNEDFAPYGEVIEEKDLGEDALARFRESYEYPVLLGLFRQRLAEEVKEREADDDGRAIEIPDDYVRGEQGRMARAVLMAMEPDIQVAEAVEAEPVATGA